MALLLTLTMVGKHCLTSFYRMIKRICTLILKLFLPLLVALTTYCKYCTDNNVHTGYYGILLKVCLNILEKALPKVFTDALKTVQETENSNKTNYFTSRPTGFESQGDKKSPRQLNILVVGKKKSGKKSTVLSFTQQKCTEYHGNSRLKYARNKKSFGRNVYALICRCLRSFTFEEKDLTDALEKGFHAVLYCFKYKDRLTNDDKLIIEALESRYGPSVIEKNTILGMTYGEDFWKTKGEKCYDDFTDFLEEMEPCDLKDVLEKFSKRCVIFENKSEITSVKEKQAVALFKMVEDIVYDNQLITNKSFDILLHGQNVVDKALIDELDSVLKKNTEENRKNNVTGRYLGNESERSRKKGVRKSQNNNWNHKIQLSEVQDNGHTVQNCKLPVLQKKKATSGPLPSTLNSSIEVKQLEAN